MMRDRNDPNFVGGDLIENTVGKPAKNVTAPCTAEERSGKWVRQNAAYGSIKLGEEREAELGIRARGIEGCGIVQLAKRERNNDQLHFSAARTCARASAIGMT